MRARDNPLATDRVLQIRYRPQGTTWDELLARLETLNYRAAIIGPESTGKTTLLEDLEPKLIARGFAVQWVPANGPIPDHSTSNILFCDGADLLSAFGWYRLRRSAKQAAGLIIATHEPGWLPTLVECTTTPELLYEILVEILGPQTTPAPAACEKLFKKHQGNIRSVLRELYDEYAAC